MGFYQEKSDEYYLQSNFWADERKHVSAEGGILFSVLEANKYNLLNFFTKSYNDTKPKLNPDYNYFPIPFELNDDLSNDTFNELLAEDIIIQLVKENIDSDIFMASTDSDKCCFIKCGALSSELIWSISSPHLNTPFIIFGENTDFFVLIDFDLPCQVIGVKNKVCDNKGYLNNALVLSGWETVLKRYASYTNMPNILRKYYWFLLPEVVRNKLS